MTQNTAQHIAPEQVAANTAPDVAPVPEATDSPVTLKPTTALEVLLQAALAKQGAAQAQQ